MTVPHDFFPKQEKGNRLWCGNCGKEVVFTGILDFFFASTHDKIKVDQLMSRIQ